MSVIEVHPYTYEWRKNFESLEQKLWPAVQSHALRIEHVGSTSVEGLWAKPIIDIDIVIESSDKIASVVKGLESLGYYHRGNLGIEGREVLGHDSQEIRHHLYLCIDGCLAYRNHVLLRDHLRQNPADRDRYSFIKQRLAEQFPNDIDSYIDGKTEFILSVLAKYELSARGVEAIKTVNLKPQS